KRRLSCPAVPSGQKDQRKPRGDKAFRSEPEHPDRRGKIRGWIPHQQDQALSQEYPHRNARVAASRVPDSQPEPGGRGASCDGIYRLCARVPRRTPVAALSGRTPESGGQAFFARILLRSKTREGGSRAGDRRAGARRLAMEHTEPRNARHASSTESIPGQQELGRG